MVQGTRVLEGEGTRRAQRGVLAWRVHVAGAERWRQGCGVLTAPPPKPKVGRLDLPFLEQSVHFKGSTRVHLGENPSYEYV